MQNALAAGSAGIGMADWARRAYASGGCVDLGRQARGTGCAALYRVLAGSAADIRRGHLPGGK